MLRQHSMVFKTNYPLGCRQPWYGKRDLNSQHLPCRGSDLPLIYCRMVRVTGIELVILVWKTSLLPLQQTRMVWLLRFELKRLLSQSRMLPLHHSHHNSFLFHALAGTARIELAFPILQTGTLTNSVTSRFGVTRRAKSHSWYILFRVRGHPWIFTLPKTL